MFRPLMWSSSVWWEQRIQTEMIVRLKHNNIFNLTFRWPCIVINSYNKNQLGVLISQIYFWNKSLHVSDSSSVHHQEFFTVHTAMVYVIQVCWQLASRIRKEKLHVSDRSSVHHQEFFTIHIPLLCVQWKSPDDGHRTCPKHVKIYSKNKFEKLVHLVGFIIRIYSIT